MNVLRDSEEQTLGNFGVYQKILKGISPFTSFLVEVEGEYYAVKDIRVDAGKGVVLTINDSPRVYKVIEQEETQ